MLKYTEIWTCRRIQNTRGTGMARKMMLQIQRKTETYQNVLKERKDNWAGIYIKTELSYGNVIESEIKGRKRGGQRMVVINDINEGGSYENDKPYWEYSKDCNVL